VLVWLALLAWVAGWGVHAGMALAQAAGQAQLCSTRGETAPGVPGDGAPHDCASCAQALAAAAPQEVTWFERDLCQLVLQVPDARAALVPLIDPAGIAHPAARAILTALRDEPALSPETLLPRIPDEGARVLVARWLVEEREWPDLAAEVAARRRRLERRQAQRRVREISQTVAQSEAAGSPTDFSSLHAAIGQETARIRADAGSGP